eukprot:3836412-Prymnesium_polylepis.1
MELNADPTPDAPSPGPTAYFEHFECSWRRGCLGKRRSAGKFMDYRMLMGDVPCLCVCGTPARVPTKLRHVAHTCTCTCT